jgi:hypothetical protein
MDRMNADRGVETHRGAEKGKVSHGGTGNTAGF